MNTFRLLACAILWFSAVSLAAAPAPDGFVLIKGGTFNMGSPANEDWRVNDETLHRSGMGIRGSKWLEKNGVKTK